MARRKAQWKRPAPKVLATPESKRVVRCYACQGKAYFHRPTVGEPAVLVLVNKAGETRNVRSSPAFWTIWACDSDGTDGWRVLGWIPPEDQMRHGALDVVDPELADWNLLPEPNKPVSLGAPGLPTYVDIVPWDEEGNPVYDW